MIKLEIELDNIDYDSLLEQYLPKITEELRASGNPVGMLLSNGMPAAMAKKIFHGLSPESKDKLTADILKANKNNLIKALREFAEKQNIRGDIKEVRITTK